MINCRRFMKRLASLEFTVICLLYLGFLLIGGTIYQAQAGIYAAQQKIFASWFFWIFKVFPLPGMALTGALLLVNLLAALLLRLRFHWRHGGLLLIHWGLLFLIGGGFFIAATAQEGFLTLGEGESSQTFEAASEWEIAAWPTARENGQVIGVPLAGMDAGLEFIIPGTDLLLTLNDFFPHCRVVKGEGSGQRKLEPLPAVGESAENIPGARLTVRRNQDRVAISVFGGDSKPLLFVIDDVPFHFSLRLKRLRLPLSMKLLDFKKKLHPGSDIPESFVSRVEIAGAGWRRQAVISMNRPLRYREYAFYQSSYSEGPEIASSTFHVVRSYGRWLPYAASFFILLGLVVHFLIRLIAGSGEQRMRSAP